MAYQAIGIGSSANDGTGDTLRVGADKVNDNFVEIYTALGAGSTTALKIVTAGASANDALIYNSSNARFEPSPIIANTFTTLTNEGDTDDSFETSISVIDPTADRTINFPNASGTVITSGNTSDLVMGSSLVFEGSTADSFETTLQVVDPTADRTITLQNASGTVAFLTDITGGGASEFSTVKVNSNVIFEGSTADSFETTLGVTDPTADRTVTIPNATGHVALFATAATGAITDGSNGQFLKTNGSGVLSFGTVSNAADDITAGDAAVTIATSAGNITIDAQGGDTDIIFKGTDGSSDITPMTLDMSDAGALLLTGGKIDLKNSGTRSKILFYCESGNAHAQTLQAAPHSESASNTLTLPSTGGDVDLVSTASTATLTNKTLTSPKINENVVVSSTATELNLLDGATVTTTEINIIDGDTSASATTLADADRLVTNDAGTMKQVALTDVKTYLSSAGFSTEDPTALAIALG